MNRRIFFRTAGAACFVSSTRRVAKAATAVPEGPGVRLEAVRVGRPTRIPGTEGDTWVLAWADDDNLYSPVNDGLGFTDLSDVLSIFDTEQQRLMENDPDATEKIWTKGRKAEAIKVFSMTRDQLEKLARLEKQEEGEAVTVGFNRITGSDPLKLAGTNLNASLREFKMQDRGKQLPSSPEPSEVGPDGRTWKSSGCSFIDGALYLAISRHDYGDPFGKRLRQDAINSSFIRSTDYGKTWARSAKENFQSPMFPGAHFATPYFIEYGRTQATVDGADRYVYAISNNGFWDNGDTLILGRVLRSRLSQLNGSDWEFFTGGEGSNSTNWTRDAERAKPILEDPRKLGETGAVYLPARRRYMMITWYYPDGTGHAVGAGHKTVWKFLESPHPWGPWTQIGSHTWFPQGYYCPGICPKFQSANRVYVMTTGDFTNSLPYYHLTVVPIELI